MALGLTTWEYEPRDTVPAVVESRSITTTAHPVIASMTIQIPAKDERVLFVFFTKQ